MNRLFKRIRSSKNLWLYLRVTYIFTLLFSAIAAKALITVMAVESNPFFYANF